MAYALRITNWRQFWWQKGFPFWWKWSLGDSSPRKKWRSLAQYYMKEQCCFQYRQKHWRRTGIPVTQDSCVCSAFLRPKIYARNTTHSRSLMCSGGLQAWETIDFWSSMTVTYFTSDDGMTYKVHTGIYHAPGGFAHQLKCIELSIMQTWNTWRNKLCRASSST